MNKLLTVIVLLCSWPAQAQDIFKAEDLARLPAELAALVGANGMGVKPNVIKEGGYFAHIVHREAGPGFAEMHDAWSDVYVVIDGQATLITGGTLVGRRDTGPGEYQAEGIDGGNRQVIGKGDIVHIPPGIPHHVLVEAGNTITYFLLKAQPE